jgi:hypothetical protein
MSLGLYWGLEITQNVEVVKLCVRLRRSSRGMSRKAIELVLGTTYKPC